MEVAEISVSFSKTCTGETERTGGLITASSDLSCTCVAPVIEAVVATVFAVWMISEVEVVSVEVAAVLVTVWVTVAVTFVDRSTAGGGALKA